MQGGDGVFARASYDKASLLDSTRHWRNVIAVTFASSYFRGGDDYRVKFVWSVSSCYLCSERMVIVLHTRNASAAGSTLHYWVELLYKNEKYKAMSKNRMKIAFIMSDSHGVYLLF